MALTLVVRSGLGRGGAEAKELSITYDSPRVVIGRGDAADLRLPDPSVSHRHATLRARGTEYVVIDENSTNGTFFGRVLLAPQSPRVIRSGELIRTGRVWLQVRIEAAIPTAGPGAAAKQLALELVSRSLEEQNEQVRPRATVVEGPDAGKELCLQEGTKRYVLGRGKESDLVLDDPDASRRHVELTVVAGEIRVVDLGSKAGVFIDDVAVGIDGAIWRPGALLVIGANRLALVHAAAEALAELERSPDERMPRDEEVPPPEGLVAADAEPSANDPAENAPSAPLAPREDAPAPERARQPSGWSLTDGAVLVLAVGVLVVSVTALLWLLGR